MILKIEGDMSRYKLGNFYNSSPDPIWNFIIPYGVPHQFKIEDISWSLQDLVWSPFKSGQRTLWFTWLSCFLGGLKDEIKYEVKALNPYNPVAAYGLAKIQEEKLAIIRSA